MGRCHEFGLQISEGCGHEMVANENECSCAGCGVVCGGQFAGCPDVWARGQPEPVHSSSVVRAVSISDTLDRPHSGTPANGSPNGADSTSSASPTASVWPAEDPLPPRDQPLHTPAPAVPEPEPVRPTVHFAEDSPAPAQASEPASSGNELLDVHRELRAVTDNLKLQQSMLADLLNGLTRQQAMMAELLDARHAELRLAMVAESLPDAVQEAVTKSFSANQEELTEAAANLADSLGMDRAIAKALNTVANWSDDRFEELCQRQEKLVARAMRAGARQPATTAKSATRAKPATRAKAAPARKPAKKAAAKKTQAKKTSRT